MILRVIQTALSLSVFLSPQAWGWTTARSANCGGRPSLTAVGPSSSSTRPHNPQRQSSTVMVAPLLASSSSSSSEDFAEDESARSRPPEPSLPQNSTSAPRNSPRRQPRDIQQRIRISRVKAEMDRLLNSPDAPIDLEQELKKVVTIAPPQASVPAELTQLESHESQLEQDLYQAAKRQDMDAGAKIKRDISQLYIDDCGSVLYANAQFYKAFTNQDYPHMATLWTRDGTATCIHPACQPLIGTRNILASWKNLFNAPVQQRTIIEPQKIRLAVKGASTAILTCEEHVFTRRYIQGQKRQTELANKLVATNIFRKVNGRWLLHHHHASWHADSRASRMGMEKLGNKGTDSSSNEDDKNSQADANIMHGILGGPDMGPIIFSGSKRQPEGNGKRVVAMGSLSDLLNGNLGSILGGDGSNSNAGGPNIIRITSRSSDGDEEEDDDIELMDETDDEEDDDEEDDEEEDDDEEEVTDIEVDENVFISRWNKDQRRKRAVESDETNNLVTGAPKDTLRQACITALRKLCNQGAISPKQKRVLLTDIISCSKKGDFSMVEVAYELLCGESDDKDAAEEEFADQCRVLAHSLPDPLAPSI